MQALLGTLKTSGLLHQPTAWKHSNTNKHAKHDQDGQEAGYRRLASVRGRTRRGCKHDTQCLKQHHANIRSTLLS